MAETVPTNQDRESYSQSLLTKTSFEKEYELDNGRITIILRAPSKKAIDWLTNYIDKVDTRRGEAYTQRVFGTLKARLYIKSIAVEDRIFEFKPVGQLLEERNPNLLARLLPDFVRLSDRKLIDRLTGSFDFADEPFYNMVVGLTDQFRELLGELYGEESGEGLSDLEQFVTEKIKDGTVTPSTPPGDGQEIADRPQGTQT